MSDMTVKWCNECGEGIVNFCRGITGDCPMKSHIERNNEKYRNYMNDQTPNQQGHSEDDLKEGT